MEIWEKWLDLPGLDLPGKVITKQKLLVCLVVISLA